MHVLGIDGCKGGWVGLTLVEGRASRLRFAERLEQLTGAEPEAVAIGVDMPLGLLDAGWREAEAAARAFLGPRRSSVFLIPPRAVVACGDYAEANALCRSETGKGLSKQAFHLFPRMRELDLLAARDSRLHEVHPEVSFQILAGGESLESKKSALGQARRRQLLTDAGIHLDGLLGDAGPAASDDVLDAAVVAWSAARIASGRARSFPERGTQLRAGGVPIRIQA